jgi:PAS domain S-box-containing protein
MGNARETTARLMAAVEAAFDEHEERTRAILETTVDGIITINELGLIESFNSAAERLFGYTAAEVIGKNVNFLMPSPYHEAHDGYLEHYRRTGEKRIIGIGREVSGLRKDGLIFPIELAVSEVRFTNQRIFTGVVRDITERKRLEQELLRASRMELVGQLASGIAHEIGTPLNIISGNAELLRMELQERGESAEIASTIIEQIDRITGLVTQLLTFAQAQEEPMASLLLQAPLNHALRLLETRFRREEITVHVDIPMDVPCVWGIANQLEQVFLNVLINAWHAMPEGGAITIRADVSDADYVRLAFCDTGLGLAVEDVQRVFEPFYSTKGAQGTGLGLAICRQIMDAHRGAIYLSSMPNAGTTVTIELLRANATL